MPPNKSKRVREDMSDEERPTKKTCPDIDIVEDESVFTTGEGSGSLCKGQLKSPAPTIGHQKPAELFRKDLISAMKLADSEQLVPEEYLYITDSWKQDWEKGVQVPVNEDLKHEPQIRENAEKAKTTGDFKMPRKLLHSCKDETYKQGDHELTGMQQLADQVVRYDLDDLDVSWLDSMNAERLGLGLINIHEWIMERVIEGLENQYYEQAEKKKKTEEGLGIEYDEDIVCEVCRSPESEECNEMVFCDGCDICVHQACYGIQKIPEGSWLCRPCALGIKPTCILCPRSSGAMKSTRSGTKWAHVSCALWIPEVSIGDAEKMEPVTKISQIPASRWALICCLCKERKGACIQCCVKACKTAFHVSCAHHNTLEMKTILTDDVDLDGGLKLKGYCPRHSKNRDRKGSESDTDSPRKSPPGSPRKGLTDEEIARMRAEKTKKLQEEFYSIINLDELSRTLELDIDIIESIYEYWKLKRKSMFGAPLLTPKTEEEDFFEKQQEDSLLSRMKMFVQLRQDLERVRNLCYMVSKREKMKKQYYKSRIEAFHGLNDALVDMRLSDREAQKIVELYPEQNIYYNFDPSAYETSPDIKEEIEDLHLEKRERSFTDFLLQDDDTQDYIPELSSLSPRKDAGDAGSEMGFSGKLVTENLRNVLTIEPDRLVQTKKERYKRKKELKERNFCDVFIMSPDEVDMTKSGDYRLRSTTFTGISLIKADTSKHERIRRKTLDSLETKAYDEEEDFDPSVSPIKRELRTRRQTCDADMFANENSKSPRELRSASISIKDEPKEINVIRNLSKSSKAGNVTDRVKAELNNYILGSKLVVADYIKDTVQKGLLENKRVLRNNFLNGMIDRSKKKENCVNSNISSPVCLSPVNGRRSISRVLNEISPSRASTPSDNGWCKNPRCSPRTPSHIVNGENGLLDRNSPGPATRSSRRKTDNGYDSDSREAFSTRSSRENSPASIRSFRRVLKMRSDSPSSRKSFNDSNHGFVDVENIYTDSDNTPLKRVTRSQVFSDNESSRDSLDFKDKFSTVLS
ncbi:JADE3 [Mytilus edulis]|uniref:JADE3 n=1 Tax=Mytilus edulis TaxID=6550 RepID=A0A8S3UUZ8_MYTED|nr:JADE3 [Mytilus edulis]